MTAGSAECKYKSGATDKEADEIIKSHHTRKGIVIGEQNIGKIIDNSEGGFYSPIKFNKDNSISANSKKNFYVLEKYNKLEAFATKKLEQFIIGLKDGNIEAKPIRNDKYQHCDYCDYWSICDNYQTSDAKIVDKADAGKLDNIIKVEDKGGESDEC